MSEPVVVGPCVLCDRYGILDTDRFCLACYTRLWTEVRVGIGRLEAYAYSHHLFRLWEQKEAARA